MSKVIFIGIDGMDPNLTENMMKRGELPNFSRLAEQGQYSRLQTLNPPQSPVVWASIATGKNPGEHGVFDFIHRNPKNYLPHLSLLQRDTYKYIPPVKAKTFWERAAEKGIPSVILKWPVAFPAIKTNGKLLAGLGVPDVKGMLGVYTFFTTDQTMASPDKKGRIIKVGVVNNKIMTEIPGPFSASLIGRKEAAVPLEIEIHDGHIQCLAGKAKVGLRERQWSEWVFIQFDLGMFKKITALCRFYLKSIKPEFNLYMTPLNVSPESSDFPCAAPREYGKELSDAIGPFATLGLAEDTNALNEGALNEDEFIIQCDQIMSERERMFFHEFNRFNEGILACVFDTTDRIQHMFWRTIDPTHPLYDMQSAMTYEHVIPDYYRRMDRTVGTVLDNSSPDTRLLICSDHGFTSFKKAVHLNTWLVRNGFMKFKKGYEASEGLFDGVDWGNTRAYAVGLTSMYLNRKGREGDGIVTKDEAPEVLRELAGKLKLSTDNGKSVVKDVYDTGIIFSGKEMPNAPDAIIAYEKEYRGSWQTAVGGVPVCAIIEDNLRKWSGDHCCDGVLVPGVVFSNLPFVREHSHVEHIAGLLEG